MKRRQLLAAVCSVPLAPAVLADEVCGANTAFKLIGPDHKMAVEAFDDPKAAGVTCHVSRSKAGGGITGAKLQLN